MMTEDYSSGDNKGLRRTQWGEDDEADADDDGADDDDDADADDDIGLQSDGDNKGPRNTQ